MRLWRALPIVSVFLVSSLALGAGFEYPDEGAEALGRAGAFTAKADDGTAIYYNPAGLAEQDGLRIMLDSNFVANGITFQRTDPVTGAMIGPPVSNSGPLFIAPFVTVSYQIVKHLTVAVGVYGPPADGQLNFPGETPPPYDPTFTKYPNGCPDPCTVAGTIVGPPLPAGPGNDPQKYGLISDNIFVAYPTLALAWTPIAIDGLLDVSLGVSGQMVYATTQISQATFDGAINESSGHQTTDESPAWDTIANVNVSNSLGERFAGIFGLGLKLFNHLRVGASYRPWIPIDESGTLKLQYSTLFQVAGATISGKNTTQAADNTSGTGPADFYLQMPGEFKSGVGWDFGHGSDVEVDFNYTQWSQVKELALVPNFAINTTTPAASTPVPTMAIPENFNDTWALRVGGDYRLPIPGPIRVAVRAGLSYETSVFDGSQATIYPSLSYSNFDMYSFAAGVSAGFKWIELAVGYTHVYEPTKTVTNGGATMTQNVPAGSPTPPAVVVDDGTYTTSYDVFAVGLKLRFL
ncbi:MAG TPA: outer membrane protein transport protein [Myxococcales bacterium]|nr:outer membrane protein transport protein [Myxococcales bacterium]